MKKVLIFFLLLASPTISQAQSNASDAPDVEDATILSKELQQINQKLNTLQKELKQLQKATKGGWIVWITERIFFLGLAYICWTTKHISSKNEGMLLQRFGIFNQIPTHHKIGFKKKSY